MQWNLKIGFKSFHLIETWCHVNVYPKSDADSETFTSYLPKSRGICIKFLQ